MIFMIFHTLTYQEANLFVFQKNYKLQILVLFLSSSFHL